MTFCGVLTGLNCVVLAQDDKEAWHGSIALGLSLTRGNSSTFNEHASAGAEKLLKADEIRLGIDQTYGINNFGKPNEVDSADSIHGFADYKHLFTERLYGDFRVEGLHDTVANLQYRFNLGPAIGYYLIKSDNSRLSVEAGPGVEFERQNHMDHNFFTLRFTERGEHSFSKTAKVWEQVDYLPQIDSWGNYLVIFEAGAEAAMNARLSLRVVFQDRYNNRPAPGKLANDMMLISALVYKFGK
jgi:putative salt-induced outer membrane protein YdiY